MVWRALGHTSPFLGTPSVSRGGEREDSGTFFSGDFDARGGRVKHAFRGLENVLFRLVWTFLSDCGRCCDCLCGYRLWLSQSVGLKMIYFEGLTYVLSRSR